jgi:hypothetical protein
MRFPRAVLFLTAFLVVSSAGCKAIAPGLFGERRARPMIRIDVTNLNFQDATLIALRGGERHRLGTVTGKGSASYTLEWRTPQSFQIEIDLLAGGRCTTRPVTIDPGQQINLQIEVDLRRQIDCYSGRAG